MLPHFTTQNKTIVLVYEKKNASLNTVNVFLYIYLNFYNARLD